MNKYENPVSFTGKLNTDDTHLLLPQGDYFKSEYFRVVGGVAGETGQGQSITGNRLITNASLPSGDNFVIGSCQYTEQGKIIYFVWNENNSHSIFSANPQNDTIELIAQSSVFNFKLDYPIIHSFVIDNKLYWTDGYFGSYENLDWNGPRRLDIPWAISGGTITREAISWDIYQPWRPPTCAYTTDTDLVPTNYLTGKLFQFRYQWVYRTGEESVWSPVSKCPLPSSSYVEGLNSASEIVDNIINVSIYTGSENVRILRIAYRVGNSGEFRVYKELDKELLNINDNTTYIDQFTKDEFIYALPLALKNNERFPRISECVELLPTNEAAFANFFEGYNKEIPLLTVKYKEEQLENYNGLISYAQGRNRWQAGSIFSCEVFFNPEEFVQNGRFYFNEGDKIVFQVKNVALPSSPILTVRYTVGLYSQATAALRWTAFISDFTSYLISEFGFTVTSYTSAGVYFVTISDYYVLESPQPVEVDTYSPIAFLSVIHKSEATRTYKTGALHQFAIQYYDNAQKDGTVWRGDVSRIKVPSVATISQDLSDTVSPFVIKMDITIGGLNGEYQPPMWASYYQIMYKPPRIEWEQRAIKNISFLSNGRIKINLEDKYEQSYRGASINYQIQVGDTVRFIRRSNNAMIENEYLGEYCNNVTELIVYEYGPSTDVGGEYIIIDNIGVEEIFNPTTGILPWVNGSGYSVGSNAFIEIYRSSEALDTDPWYEVSEVYPVNNPYTPQRKHQGQTLNVSPATFTIGGGNAFLRKRPQGGYMTGAFDFQMGYIEDPDFSDYFPSRVYNYGRIGIEDSNAKERHFVAAVGHTSQYLDNTRINRLNQVDFQNVKYLREEHGPINRIIMNGYTLSVLQNRKNTSIYTQRTMAVNGDGVSNIILTDRTFSDPRPLEQDWGAVHGGGVIVAFGNLYYYDYLNNIFVVSTGGGQVNLSLEMKYMKGSKELSETYASVSGKRLFSCVKQQFNEVYWAFRGLGGVAFNPSVGFVYNTAHPEECVGTLGKYNFSFLDGNIYVDNEGDELVFNGAVVETSIGWVFNVGSTVVKEFLNLWIQSNKRWDVWDIRTAGNLNYTEMQSYLLPEMFNAQEGYLVSPYRRDKNDPSFTDVDRAYVDGRALRGYVLSHIMSYGGEEKAYLFNAAVRFKVSNPVNS